ncbi:MAG: hypothetical protein NT062_27375 [Proteobacteria bacterium]|nr:hypothetical protein [Pseudomonadota bacterium]
MAATSVTEAAADGTLLTDDTWRYAEGGALVVDAGLAVAMPAALPTGLATGVGIGMAHGRGVVVGARASWVTTTESSTVWTVTHSDLRLRLTGGLERTAGRGTVGLRLGVGGTVVHETRLRNQGMRAGLMGADLENAAIALLPAADLELVVGVHVSGHWLLELGGGPTLEVLAGGAHAGFGAQLGVGWRP